MTESITGIARIAISITISIAKIAISIANTIAKIAISIANNNAIGMSNTISMMINILRKGPF